MPFSREHNHRLFSQQGFENTIQAAWSVKRVAVEHLLDSLRVVDHHQWLDVAQLSCENVAVLLGTFIHVCQWIADPLN